MSKISITIIPFYMIETGEGRRAFNTFATEMSCFYFNGMDWAFLCVETCDCNGFYWWERRN